jgi:hypothetical protein
MVRRGTRREIILQETNSMSGVFQNIDPLTASPLVRGEDTLAGWRGGVGGQYFRRRQTQLCTLHLYSKYFVMGPYDGIDHNLTLCPLLAHLPWAGQWATLCQSRP